MVMLMNASYLTPCSIQELFLEQLFSINDIPPNGFFEVPRFGAADGVSLWPRDGDLVGAAIKTE